MTSLHDRSNVTSNVESLKREGWLLFENRLPRELVAALHREYTKVLAEKMRRFQIRPAAGDGRLHRNDGVLADFRPEGGNHDLNRWNMHLPSCGPFLDSRVIADVEMMAILEGVLGAEFVLVSLVSDTSFPGSGFQNVHQDDVLLRMTINIPLVDITTENGPTEIWPRTHRATPEDPNGTGTSESYAVDATEMKRRLHLPSIKPCVAAGSFIVRDHRLMHRGTPNRSMQQRPMLTLNYASNPRQVPFPLATDCVARLALALRERARASTSRRQSRLAGAGHTINRVNEFLAGSDRDYRRTISQTEWSKLSAEARQVLRYAAVDGLRTDRRADARLFPTARLLAHTAKNLALLATAPAA